MTAPREDSASGTLRLTSPALADGAPIAQVFTCDGKNHVARFSVDQLEGKQSYGSLVKGTAWVQFCLFDDTTPKGDGETDFGQPVSSTVWVNVR